MDPTRPIVNALSWLRDEIPPPPPPPPPPEPVKARPPEDTVAPSPARSDGTSPPQTASAAAPVRHEGDGAEAPGVTTTAAPAPATTPADLDKRVAELKNKSPQDLEKIYKAFADVGSDELPRQLKGLGVLSTQFPAHLDQVLEQAGVKDDKIVKLATRPGALTALGTLYDPKASRLDTAKAVLDLSKETADVLAPEDLRGVLGKTIGALPAGSKLIDAVIALRDDKKSGFEQAKASLDAAVALKDFVGEISPGLRRAVAKLDGASGVVGAALTLMNPDASLPDKIVAGVKLLAELPDLKKDLTRCKDLLKIAGVKDAELVIDGAVDAGEQAKQVLLRGLSSAVARQLSEPELTDLRAVATKVGPEALGPILGKLDSAEAVKGLMGQLNRIDGDAGKRLLTITTDMDGDGLRAVLEKPANARSLADLASKLDDTQLGNATKLLKGLDEGALQALFKLTDRAPAPVLANALRGLGPVLDTVGSKPLGQSLELLDRLLGKMGTEITGEAAEKVWKTLIKILPVVGAVPGLIDAAKYTKAAIDLHDRNQDLAMFATVGAGLNAIDSIGGLVLSATGVGAAVDVTAGIAFGIAELALDLSFDAEKKKFEAHPDSYEAPDWMKAVNLGFAAATGGAGVTALLSNYGFEGTVDLVKWGIESGSQAADKLLGELAELGELGFAVAEQLADQGVTAARDFLVSRGRRLLDGSDGEVTIAGRQVNLNPLW